MPSHKTFDSKLTSRGEPSDKIYITIDLDYWAYKSYDKHLDYIHKACSLDVDKIAVIAHHRIIPHIKNLKPNKIFNIDYHSDICIGKNLGKKNLNCGVWANYIESEHFQWVHPHQNRHDMDLGYCHLRDGHNPFKINISPHGKVTHSNIFPKLNNVVGLSICLSPVYGGSKELFYDLVDQYKLPIIEKKGDWFAL